MIQVSKEYRTDTCLIICGILSRRTRSAEKSVYHREENFNSIKKNGKEPDVFTCSVLFLWIK